MMKSFLQDAFTAISFAASCYAAHIWDAGPFVTVMLCIAGVLAAMGILLAALKGYENER